MVADIAQMMARGDVAWRACAHSDARAVHVWTSDARIVSIRTIEYGVQVLHGIIEQLCMQGCALNNRSRCHGHNIGLVGSGVCEIKYRFVLSCVRFCSPPPPGGSMLSLVSGGPNLSEKKSRSCIRTCPFDHPNIDPFGGRGGQRLARLNIKRDFISQTPG